jgi:hypothetical protein
MGELIMKRAAKLLLMLVALSSAPIVSFANGGGGVEYFTNAGSDLLGPSFFSGGLVDLTTGSITSLSAFGYGVTHGGWKIGGFGTGFYAKNLSLVIPEGDMTVNRSAGAFGGVISGGAGRLGLIGYSVNTRLGAGGLAVEGIWTGGSGLSPMTAGVFSLYASVDAEAGIILVPAMLVSVYVSIDAIVPIAPYFIAFLAVPTLGARISWGRF